ncbi:MAG: hypothetical protein ACYDHM_01205 [Acidiferrobacterales bacterium]
MPEVTRYAQSSGLVARISDSTVLAMAAQGRHSTLAAPLLDLSP